MKNDSMSLDPLELPFNSNITSPCVVDAAAFEVDAGEGDDDGDGGGVFVARSAAAFS